MISVFVYQHSMSHERDKDQHTRKDDSESDPIRAKMDAEGKRAYDLMFPKHYVLTATIFGYVIGSILIFGGSGYLLDHSLDTQPAFLIIGLILGFIAAQLAIYKKYSTQ